MNSKMKQNLVLVADNDKLIKFRKEKDKHWKEDEQSPLTEEQKKTFKRLNYFLPNPDLRFELPLLTDIPDLGKQVVIKTTGGDEQVYKRAGKIRFKVDGKEIETIVFEDPEVEQFQYYLLFKDKTTGKETYENGRMLQIEKKGDKLVVDFNYCYNPYSSYNDNWDCPITPKENTLNVEINAGEKKFI
ncbi:hypothetical protein A3J17_05140 [Candidatus Curtissbacteria bacterium RIFCSPLOWO2_02_FULL_40_11]|uniref:DUF1684 domain-containing protein n=1 Tax=Candidatus Curtissbacteria bacterium RIFCSPHIGHO2_02_FULL_40_16b TaxID=1797714 RepID=A0A1F5GC79_9BACT|nr:MAG: hypothetical protein A3D04_02085 [Candidatus Curtissbacteria bacterium RIFCSPHIGHO2_02_FULL_40_16b]OGE00518.1 MAG: hypothetical protein A3J17_05140 [Candidatus Curtissbacteria bacterium RIFCSPLOWO2_02_FULL_40_11]